MEQYIVRKISKTIKDKYYHKYYDKRDKEIKDKKGYALYVSNRICLYEHNNTLLYSPPEQTLKIIKDY